MSDDESDDHQLLSRIRAAQEVLEKLCRVYWRPIYGCVRRQGVVPPEAEDLTQGFLRHYWSTEI